MPELRDHLSATPCTLLPWQEQSGQTDSLALALAALCAAHSIPRTYDEIVSARILPTGVNTPRNDETNRSGPPTNDIALIRETEKFGLRFRDLHPPAAATNLELSAEFPQHFIDSYIPLIRRALEHGQPVLAWRGWPLPNSDQWGVIVESRNAALLGYTLGCRGRAVELVGAAHQVYVVEA